MSCSWTHFDFTRVDEWVLRHAMPFVETFRGAIGGRSQPNVSGVSTASVPSSGCP